jgi:hypothetical protein
MKLNKPNRIVVSVLFTLILFVTMIASIQGCSGGSTDEISLLEPAKEPPTSTQELINQATKCLPFAATTQISEKTLPVDILWVIDTSYSMCDLQQKISDAMDSLTIAFSGLSLDVRMGCVTASMLTPGQSGELQALSGSPKYVSGLDQASLDTFRANCPIGCNGHPYEFEFTPIVTALEMSQAGMPNEGFLRDDASFTAIALTDEEDLSSSPIIEPVDHPYHFLYNSPQDFVNKLIQKKNGNVNRVNYNLIAHIDPDPNGSDPDPCYDTTDAQNLKGIEAINFLSSQKTNGKPGGAMIDICSTIDYSPLLPSLINTALETEITEVNFIDLSGIGFEPNPNSITLKLSNGTVVTTGWHYDAAQKKIILDDSTLKQSQGELCSAPKVGEF